jgi:Zn-dependent protease
VGIFSQFQVWGDWLKAYPLDFILYFIGYAVAILLTLMLHEVAHGYIAYRCGDNTAKMMGRLTLNPLKHLDPIGTICLFLFRFGWAKPVPVNPRNFHGNHLRCDFLVSIAGIVTNLTLFIVSLFLASLVNPLLWKPEVISHYGAKYFLNMGSDGYYTILSSYVNLNMNAMQMPWLLHVERFLLIFSTLNVMIAVFNLIPIPPLDGFHVFNDLILKGRLQMTPQFARGAQIVFLLLIFSGVLGTGLLYVTTAIQNGVLKLFLLVLGG